MFKLFSKYSKGYKLQSFLSPLFVALESFMEVLIPLYMADIIDRIDSVTSTTINPATTFFVRNPMNFLIGIFNSWFPNVGENSYIYVYTFTMIILAAFSMFCGVMSGIMATSASSGFAKNVRKELYHHIQDYSFENIDKFSTASLITRLTTDISNCQQSFQMSIRILIRAPLLFAFSLIMSFITNPSLAWIFVVATPILVVLLAIVIISANPYFRQMFKKYDKLNLVVQENITGIRTVKAYTNEDYEIEKFVSASKDVADMSKKAEKIVIFNNPIMQSVVNISILLVTFLGTKMIMEGTGYGSGDTLFLFISYAVQILSSLMMLSMIFMMLMMSKASADRISEAIDEKPIITNCDNPIMEVKDGSVEFNNVNFSYVNDENKLALKNVNFKIESGMTVGVFGGTGSGKSTIVSLIPRLYDTFSGCVKVGGLDVKNYDIKTLRDEVSVVLQKNVLFSGTIKENLRWGNKDATDEEMIHACKLAQAHDFIMSFPNGYDTYIEQGGVNVSGGQKQRLCIARALLKKPKILILDDSTSAVDTKTDSLIRKAFKEEIPNTTKFIISQRISSIEDADLIMFVNEGIVENVGKHEEMLKINDTYRAIYEVQKKGVK